jgi:hypothetical protein
VELGPYLLGQNDTQENGIYAGDARELAEAIPDESVDLIFTDPVYQNIDDYEWLAETAARILKPDRPCIAWTSKVQQYECKPLMEQHLSYMTTLFYTVMAKQTKPAFQIGIMSWTTPALAFTKGQYKCNPFLVDTLISSAKPQSGFKWQKNTPVAIKWLEAFNKHKGIVVDFFTGSGSIPAACKILSMPYLAFEIVSSRCDEARERVRSTMIPFFYPEPEQLELL